ncbi:LacI family transcriptional regulator [Alicyclobacillus fastidiosus]|uniref:LacI family transcriptional regulator n=1 Tax=Alicyclobacillus fastidiosus TaxID=392011 RepID=A0ABY6ZBL2_9BACL|nr:LacI family DNA-binding transcriptional regulator [Alicyclobacillus fastidiosus]WAH40239.1 LacI family transcriptional regulator [Alicyclobacillus fastidiosus]GMA61604.1 LacI family transcriptional regulator [Alicyclobacillus fastidiosus]
MSNTIKEVAKLAGVSVSTVSRVINNSGYVGEKTRKKIVDAMDTLSFEPSSIARGLVSGKTSTIGLLLPDVSNPFFAEVARGTEEAAIESGFTVILCNSNWDLERERMYLNVLKGRAVEGVIVIGNRSAERDLIGAVSPLPCVFVDRKVSSDQSYIWIDHEKGASIATEKLLSIGCEHIAHVTGPRKSTSARSRLSGYLKTMKQSGMEPSVVPGNFRFAGGYEAAKALFLKDNPPDGIFAANDMMAIGIIQAANELGVSIPNDVSIVGYDDIDMAKCTSPALTTIRQPANEMGRAAFSLFKNRVSEMKIEFDARLVERKSTK